MKILKKLIRSLYKRLWKEEYSKIKNLHKIDKLENLSFLNYWIDYLQNNDINKEIEILLQNTDKKSQETVNIIIKRIKLLISCYENKDIVYVNVNDIYTEEEKLNQKESKKCIKSYKNKNCLPYNFYAPNILYNHCGLKEIQFVKNYIKGKDFIDGGACIGDSAFILEKYYSPNFVYAFEPLNENIKYINKTIEMNSLKSIKPINLGLGIKTEKIELSYDPVNISSTSLLKDNRKQNKKQTEKIDITTIDNFVKENNLNLGLIKLDVEGFESNVIAGALESIKKYRPVMLISIYHTPKDFFEIKPFIESLNLNYKFKIRKCSPDTIYFETMLIAYPKELEL